MKSICDLKLHEPLPLPKLSLVVIRVPGGWIYEAYHPGTGQPTLHTFVPYNNEFKYEE